MNLTDLKQVLDERSGDSAEHVMHHMRLHGVRAKVIARRRRRIAARTAGAVAVVAGVAAAAILPGIGRDVTPSPADGPPPVRTIEGFPEYAGGTRVVAARSAALPDRRVEVTFVPTTLDLVVFSRCDALGDGVQVDAKVTVNGHDLLRGSCGGAYRPHGWDRLDVAVGRPATVVMTLTGAQRYDQTSSNTPAEIPETTTFGIAIGERIPFDQYPLPPRPPGPLEPLPEPRAAACGEARCPGAVIISSDPADPARPIRQTLAWKTLDSIDLFAQTPGLLHVRINGVEVATGEWWDYRASGNGMYGDGDGDWARKLGLRLRPGDTVTIELVPEHLSGAWQVILSPSGKDGGD